ncbi:MAG: hypothetical protein J6Y67_04920 [Lachnospiraceae bacterium]|nr:hypothetical protein [Lachnospiraceae bacterium]
MIRKSIIATMIAVIAMCLLVGCGDKNETGNKTEEPKGPSTEKSDLNKFYELGTDEVMLMVNARLSESKGIVKNGKKYLPISLASELDSRFYWNENDQQMFVTNATTRMIFRPGETAYQDNGAAKSTDAPMVIKESGEIYLCSELLDKYGRMNVTESDSPNRVSIMTAGKQLYRASVKAEEGTVMREGRDETTPIVAELTSGTMLYLAEDLSGNVWSKVMTEDGRWGYVSNLETTTYAYTTVSVPTKGAAYERHAIDGKVCMVWHSVGAEISEADFKAAIKDTKALNVIAPTWFAFKDVQGAIESKASEAYVKAAHAAGLKVWALADDFAKDVKGLDVLSHTESREALINNLVSEVTRVGADGINIDFEYITKESAPHFLQFLRELYLACKEKGLTISTDNYYPNQLNAYYRLDEQSEFVDYIIFMGYDEHYSKSKEAGSVASIGFVKGGVETMLKKVPANRLILGVPFFARKWMMNEAHGEDEPVPNEAGGMDTLKKFIKDNGGTTTWLEEVGQNYAEVTVEGKLVKIWLEDAESMKLKLDVMKDNDLAGCSGWKLGLESKDIWTLIQSYFSEGE